jgi:Protein of unknown function (DUF1538).
MRKNLLAKIKESLLSVLPICAIVLLIHATVAPLPLGTLALFLTGSVLLIVGMGIFTLGSEMAMSPMGEIMGARLTQSRNLPLLICGAFLLGVIVTVAEPDLQVLTKQVPSVPDMALIAAVAVGVGVFLVLAVLRILFQVRLAYFFIVAYAAVFLTATLTPHEYLAVGFDSGGVTTGPITVPFILAIGVGISAVTQSKKPEEDSFGICAICSIGPVLAVLILGLFYDPNEAGYAFETASTAASWQELLFLYRGGFRAFGEEVLEAMLPITVIFGVLQATTFRLPRGQIYKIGVGVLYTMGGLAIFLTGVNIGFMPAGTALGHAIASLEYNWILIPISVVIGCFVVAAEPAVYVLNRQVEEVTGGAVSRRTMMIGLSAGVGIALALSMIRILARLDIAYFLLAGYGTALALTFFVPQTFTAIAFDSGGVASGTMAAAFLLPFAVGVSDATGGNVMTDAFGIVALVAMMPLVTVQVMGLLYRIKMARIERERGQGGERPSTGGDGDGAR